MVRTKKKASQNKAVKVVASATTVDINDQQTKIKQLEEEVRLGDVLIDQLDTKIDRYMKENVKLTAEVSKLTAYLEKANTSIASRRRSLVNLPTSVKSKKSITGKRSTGLF